MRVWVGLTALMILLAGCTSGDDGTGDPTETATSTSTNTQTGTETTTQTATDTSTQTSTQTGTAAPDPRPPVASLQISEVTGTAPLVVNITVDGEDPDGDLAAWSLDLGDDTVEEGQDFPTMLNHTYSVDGNYTLNLTVTDASGLTGHMEVQLNVLSGGLDSIVITADLDNACPGCTLVTTDACIERQSMGAGVWNDCIFVEVPLEAAGLPFLLESTGGDPELRWRTGDTCPGSAGESFNEVGSESGTVPADAGCAMLWEFEVFPSTLTLTIG